MSTVKIIKPETKSNAKQFGFRLKPEYRDALEREAIATGFDISELIHFGIEAYFRSRTRKIKQTEED